MLRHLALLLCALAAAAPLSAQIQAEFFVASDGDDNFPGTSMRPFASLSRARDAVRIAKVPLMTGDIIVHIAGGEYPVTSTVAFDEQDSGTNGFSVLYKNRDAVGSAHFIGGEELTGWQLHSGNIYKTQVGSQVFHTLFENGRRSHKARTPNLAPGEGFPMSKANYLTSEGINGSRTTLKYKLNDLNPVNWNLNDAQLFIWSGGKWDWFTDVIPIAAINPVIRQIDLTQDTRYPIFQSSQGSRYFVQGVLDLLDQPGEFHLDTSTGWLYYWPLSLPIASQSIVAPRVERIISVEGSSETQRASNIRFEGLSFEVTDFTDWYRWAHVSDGDSGESHAFPQYDRKIELPQNRTGMFFLSNADNITIKFCHFKNSGYSAIYMQFYNRFHTVYGNWIEHSGHSGVYLSGKYPGEGDVSRDNLISNNKIHNIGEEVGNPAGVYLINSGHNEVSHCKIYNSPRYAISASTYVNLPNSAVYSFGNVVKYIEIYAAGQDSGDTAAIYSWGISDTAPFLSNHWEQITVDSSYAHSSVTDIAPNGIFMDNDTYGQVFLDVKATNSQSGPFRNNDSGGHSLTNVNWSGSFSDSLMEFGKIGLKADFPRQYAGRDLARPIAPSPTPPPGVTFLDGFEHGFSAWSVGKGVPTASTTTFFNGVKSYVADSDEDVIYKPFGTSLNKRVEAWFYDNGATTKATMMRVDDGIWNDGTNWVGLGVHTTHSVGFYSKRLGAATTPTPVPRSTGWHKFEWDFTSGTSVQIKIDGINVGSTASTTFFNQIALGDWWGGTGAGDNYYDDIKVY